MKNTRTSNINNKFAFRIKKRKEIEEKYKKYLNIQVISMMNKPIVDFQIHDRKPVDLVPVELNYYQLDPNKFLMN